MSVVIKTLLIFRAINILSIEEKMISLELTHMAYQFFYDEEKGYFTNEIGTLKLINGK